MSDTAILEIVELANGDVVLRPAEASSEPLVSIRFSEEALDLLRRSRFDVAREMLDHAITRTHLWDGDDDEAPEQAAETVH
ncbi:hypothetical protein [Salinicola avicenniae]|uniref:hypothetical protein n=1 Tax=Salinicola avicenniae TaxID=2916836 RepID=UPI0020743A44|nr:hypothetical protein [Salinicola sp. S1-1-8]